MNIGEIIYKKRTELGLTQAQLARELNVSFQSVSKWENNAAYPDIEKLPELAAALNTRQTFPWACSVVFRIGHAQKSD